MGLWVILILFSTELNDLRKMICLKKPEISVERISVCNVIELNLTEHRINSLPSSYISDVINMLL